MFSFFGNKRPSLFEFTSINNNQTLDTQTLDPADTASSLDSRHRHYDEESSLGSYSDVDAAVYNVVCEEVQVQEKETEIVENDGDRLQQMPLQDLHRLVGITSAEERYESKPDMPPYKIRRKIATKVMAKKISKGYLILEETCKLCDMPLIEGKGVKDCRICPVIKKWMDKHTNEDKENSEKLNTGAAEARRANAFGKEGGNKNEDQMAHVETMSDATLDIKHFMTADIRKSIKALTPIREKLEMRQTDAGNVSEIKSKNTQFKSDMESVGKEAKASKPKGTTHSSTPKTRENDTNVNVSVTIEDRAKQIIKEARGKEVWNDTAYPSNLKSPIGSNVNEAAYYQGIAEARAELIINRARATLHPDGEVYSEVGSPVSVTPELIVKKAKESLLKDIENSNQYPIPLTPMSVLRKKQSNWLDYKASKRHLTSWDAARIIQNFSRMVGPRKTFLDYLSEKRTKMYREMLTGSWKPAKVDAIFESRSREREESREGDPDGEVQHAESAHVESEMKCVKNDMRLRLDPVAEDSGGPYNSKGGGMRKQYEPDSDIHFDQLQIEHQIIDESVSLPYAQVVYDAEVVNAADMVHCSTPMIYAKTVGNTPTAKRTSCIDDPPALNAEVVNAANDPPAMDDHVSNDGQSSYPRKRNVFAKVACSFDDAVSKVVSNVKDMVSCSGSNEVILSQYKSAPISEPSADGTYFEESRRKAASYSIMYRTSLGWTIANCSCSVCQMPMMIRPDDRKLLCVVCDESDTTDNATLGTMLRSEAADQGSVAAFSKRKLIDHVPTSIGTENMTYIAVPKQRKPIDPEPVESLGGFRDEKQKKRHPRHSSARSVVSLPPKRSNGNAHHRRMSQNICSSRSVGPQSIVSEQWMLTKQCCPRCNMNMMRNGYNDSYHCHSCGTIVCASAQNPSIYVDELISIHKLPESNGEKDSNIVEKNPFVLAHQQMIASPRAMAMPHQLDSQVHPPFGFDESIYSFAQNHHNPTLHQGGLYQSLSLNACELPTPNHSRHELFNQPTPNKNRKQIKNHQYFYHPIDFKENSYGDSNLSKNEEMSAVDEAKLRMENAQNVMKKKILYYNSSSDYMF